MNFRHMQIFLAVVEEESLSSAAEKLFLTQPAITQVIRKIEDEFGGKLFVYHGRKRELTPLGKACVTSFQNILNQYKYLCNTAQDISLGTRGNLTVYTPLRRAQKIMPCILSKYQSRYPQVNIKIIDGKTRIESMFDQLIGGKIDLAITLHRIVDPRITFIPFCHEQMALVASYDTPIAQKLMRENRTTVKVEELLDIEYVLPPSIYWNRRLVDEMFAEFKREPKSILEVQTVELAKSLAISNYAPTIVPEIMIEGQSILFDQERYGVFVIEHPLAARKISIAYLTDPGLPRFQQDFINMLMDIGYSK